MSSARARLEQLRREVARPARRAARSRSSSRADYLLAAAAVAAVVAVIVFPFVLYVRTAVEMYTAGAPAWVAITVAAVVTLALVGAFAAWLTRKISGRARATAAARWIAIPLGAAWCVSTLFYLDARNAKTDEVRAYYTSLHPVLRVALATLILVDPDLVITDARRVAADYPRMGLPVNARTKHFEQPTGWVHAVDLRTRDRSEIKNRAVQLYFWSMGFSTLRHVGTADHLHVQLRTRD